MRVTIERLRLWIVIAASLLIAVLAGFFLWGGLKYRHLVQNLPHRLGANIEQTASGFTYSQSSHGHTLFTIHASKLMSFKNDHAVLHDVSITLYGPSGSHRSDKIYGAEFDYDRKTGIVSSQGKVEIALESPAQKGQPGHKRSIRVQTSHVTYNSKTGLVKTSQPTEFSLPQGSGHSMGATYNSKTGLLVLEHKVYLKTQAQGSGAIIHAAHLSFLRNSDQATLLSPIFNYRGETTTARQAVLHFRPNGSASRVTAQGNVRMMTAADATLTAQTAQMELNPQSQPRTVDLTGGVTYVSRSPRETMQGSAHRAHLIFAAAPGGPHAHGSFLQNAHFQQAVHFVERLTGAPGNPHAVITRDVRGETAEIHFVPMPGGEKSEPATITVEQNAVATLRTASSHQPPQQTTIRADKLVATLTHGRVLQTIHGTGHAEIASLGKDGATNTTHSDTLHLIFAPQSRRSKAPRNAKASPASAQLVSAIEDGHVIMRQTPAAKAGHHTQQPLTVWAERAVYTAADQTVQLRGQPRLKQGSALDLSARAIDYHRVSSSAVATGDVKATYRQAFSAEQAAPQLGGTGATHIIASRAIFRQQSGEATFYGSQHQRARIWQQGNSVSAPVITLERGTQQLRASGPGMDAVSAAFSAAMGAKAPSGLVRVTSDALTYSGQSGQGDFHGHVRVIDAFGSMRAGNLDLYIAPARKHQPARLKEMIATGKVTLTQPGRRAVGAKLVYTADNERYVLTGRPGALPYIVDRAHGRTTGAALIFNNRNDSVEVNGGEGSAVTETRISK